MSPFLSIHIAGAAVTTTIILLSFVAAIIKKGPAKIIIVALNLSAIFQILSGILVLLFVPGVSIAAVCYKGLGFIAVSVCLQYIVRLRLSY